MKRSAPGGGGGGPAKRANAPSGGGGGGGGQAKDGQGLTTSDALTYLREVKNRFTNQREIYDQFLDVMKEFKAQVIDTNGVIAKVKTLFKGHPELVMGFNMFLPAGYKIEHPGLEPPPAAAAAAAPRGGGASKPKPSVSKEQQLQRRRERDAAAAEAKKKASDSKKAAAGSKAAAAEDKSKQPVEFDQAINYVNKIKKRFAGDERVYKAFLEILNQYRKGQQSIGQVYERVSILFQDQADLLNEFTYFLPDTTNQAQKPQGKASGSRSGKGAPGTKSKPPAAPAARRETTRREEEEEEPSGRHSRHAPSSRATRAGRRAGSEEGTGGRGTVLGNGAGRGGQSAPKACLAKELNYFDRLKSKLRNRDAFNDLLRCLSMFSSDLITKAELEALVGGILVNHQDLLQGFFDFVDTVSVIDFAYEAGKDPKRDEGLTAKEKTLLETAARREKYMTTSISELDLSSQERCTTSYRHLPSDYPLLRTSGRQPQHQKVLNDMWVSQLTGSEDYSFKHMRKNQYEDALFRCEDDRFELDMVMQSNLSALTTVEKLIEKFEGMDSEEKQKASLNPKDLGVIQRRAIERLYGEQGQSVLELMDKSPAGSLPVILTRLQQKHEEFERVKAEMEPHWAKQYEANYINSLDHRSFYFKQSDKKHLSAKGVVASLKELADKRMGSALALSSVAPGPMSFLRTASLPADLELHYDDKKTHEDCYRLILVAASEYLGPTARIKAMELWHSVLEPMLGCPQHAEEQEEAEESAEVKAENAEVKAEDAMDVDGGGEAKEGENGATPDPQTGNTTSEAGLEGESAGGGARRDASSDEEDDDEGNKAGKEGKGGAGEEEEEEEDEQEEEEDDKTGRFAACRPVMPACAEWEYPAMPNVSQEAPEESADVFYCNETFFVAFRLHEILFTRLQAARKCCNEGKKRPFNPHGEKKVKTEEEIAMQKQKAQEVYERFLSSLELLVKNKMDATTFEDEMRPLLGNNAYVTFTLDKLLHKLIKQLQALVQDPTMARLQALKRYEGIRSTSTKKGPEGVVSPVQPRPMAESVYCADAVMLLQDEPCFRVALRYAPFSEDVEAAAAKGQQVPLAPQQQQREPSEQELAAGRSAKLSITLVDMPFYCPPDGPGAGPPAEFEAFLKGWLGRDDDDDTIPTFMARGLTRSLRKRVKTVGELTPDLSDCIVSNRLELKLACTTSKVSYVLGTEDVFFRKRKGGKSKVTKEQKEEIAAKKSKDFGEWLIKAAQEEEEEEEEEEGGEDAEGGEAGEQRRSVAGDCLMAAVQNDEEEAQEADGGGAAEEGNGDDPKPMEEDGDEDPEADHKQNSGT